MSSPSLNRPVASFALRMHLKDLTGPTRSHVNRTLLLPAVSFLPTLSPCPSAPTTLAFLRILQQAESLPAVGPLPLLSPLPGMLLPSCRSPGRPSLSITSIRSPCFIFFRAVLNAEITVSSYSSTDFLALLGHQLCVDHPNRRIQ